MLGALINRTRVTTDALLREAQLDAAAGHERHSAGEPSSPWSSAPCAINVLLFTTEIKQYAPFSPSHDYSFKLEITFCVRGVLSCVLANIYLHYTLDLWFERKFKPQCGGEAYEKRTYRYQQKCKT